MGLDLELRSRWGQSFAATGGANTWGRLASQVFTTKAPHDNYSYYTWTQSYGYAPGGAVTSKNLQASWWWVTNSNQYAAQMGVSYAYDNEGRVASVTYPNAYWNGDPLTGPAYQYTYDAMGRPGGMTKQGSRTALVSGVQYGVAGELTQMQYAGYSETRSYNSPFQLTGIVVDQGAIHLANFGYTYPSGANNGQISRYNDNVGGEEISYQYDALNRLISAQTTSASWGLSFSYDGYGNLTDKTVTKGSAVSLHAAVDPSTNRFSGYSYDANGNLLRYGADTYTYDAENRRSTVTTGDRRVYSPDNKWMATMSAQGPGGSVRFYGAYGELIGDYGLSIWTYPIAVQFVASDWYAYFGGRRIVKSTPYGDTPVVLDRLGSARNNGASYFPYGETRQGGTTNAYQFATYYRDTSNLDYADQRYYSSQLGRFLTPDPGWIRTANPADPQSWNRYAYVQNDPVNYHDPGGLFRHRADPGPAWSSGGNGQAVSGGGHGNMFYLAVDLGGETDTEDAGGSWTITTSGVTNTGVPEDIIDIAALTLQNIIDPDCQRWLQSGEVNNFGAFTSNLIQHGVIGYGAISTTQSNTIVNAVANPSDAPNFAIVINRSGAFFSGSASTDIGKISGGTLKAQIFILLHEYAHLNRVPGFEDDSQNPEAGRRNEMRVETNCQKTLSKQVLQ